jgi:hypothetical protein
MPDLLFLLVYSIKTFFVSTFSGQLHPAQKCEEEQAIVVVNKEDKKVKKSPLRPEPEPLAQINAPPEGCSLELWLALGEAHIGGEKRKNLALRKDLTPNLVGLWEQYLRRNKGKAYTPGLLIHVLESDEPPPPSNELGHLEGCECDECQRVEYHRCFDCGKLSCDCQSKTEAGFSSYHARDRPIGASVGLFGV